MDARLAQGFALRHIPSSFALLPFWPRVLVDGWLLPGLLPMICSVLDCQSGDILKFQKDAVDPK